ncbi:MAG: CU044_2847 family protein [Cyanobacteria bacterium P01_C01_bin.121]
MDTRQGNALRLHKAPLRLFLSKTLTMDKELAQFKLEDGTAFLVEVNPPKPSPSGSIQRVASVNTQQMVYQATQTLEQALDSIKPVASTVVSRLKSGLTSPADEVEVTFGLKLAAEAGVVFGSVGGDVTFEVKLKWERKEDQGSSGTDDV